METLKNVCIQTLFGFELETCYNIDDPDHNELNHTQLTELFNKKTDIFRNLGIAYKIFDNTLPYPEYEWEEANVNIYKHSTSYMKWTVTTDSSIYCEEEQEMIEGCVKKGSVVSCNGINFQSVELVSPKLNMRRSNYFTQNDITKDAGDGLNVLNMIYHGWLMGDNSTYLISQSQGMHVHLSHPMLSIGINMKKFLKLWIAFEPLILLTLTPARRNDLFYTQPIRDFYNEQVRNDDDEPWNIDQLITELDDTKYVAVHLINTNHIEIRLFQGTIHYNEMYNWILFCILLLGASIIHPEIDDDSILEYEDYDKAFSALFGTYILDSGIADYFKISLAEKGNIFISDYSSTGDSIIFPRSKLSSKLQSIINKLQEVTLNSPIPTSIIFTPTPLPSINLNLPKSKRTVKPSPSANSECINKEDCSSSEICVENKCIPNTYYNFINFFLNKIPGIELLPTLEFTGGVGIGTEKDHPTFWDCDRRTGGCKPVQRITEYIDQESCEENCQIGERRNRSGSRRGPLWWNCIDGKCKSSTTSGQYNNPFECYRNCKLPTERETIGCSEDSLLKNQVTIIKGHMQSGKTAFMIASAIRYRLCGLSTLIVVEGTADEIQLWNRFKDFWKTEIEAKAAEHGVHIPFQYTNSNGQTVNQLELVKVRNIKTLDLVNSPRIMITLAHVSHLRTLYREIQGTSNADKLVVMVDESDMFSATTDISQYENLSEGSIIVENHTVAERTIFIDLIKSIVYTTFLISATILDSTLKEDVFSKNIFMIPPPRDYQGINKLEFVSIPTSSKALSYKSMGTVASHYTGENSITHVNTVTETKLFTSDPNLLSYLTQFDQLSSNSIGENLFIPNITLLKNVSGGAIGPQFELYYYIKTTYNNTITVLWTGEVLKVYTPSINLRTPTELLSNMSDQESKDAKIIKSIVVKDNDISHEYQFSSTSGIEAVLTWLKLNEVGNKNIVIIAPSFGDRGITFGAGGNPGRWHLTQMYYIPSDGTPQPDILQAAGRLCGRIQDNIPLKMYATPKTIADIKAAYALQEFLISAVSLRGNESLVRSFIRQIDVPAGSIHGTRQVTRVSHTGGPIRPRTLAIIDILNLNNLTDLDPLDTEKRKLLRDRLVSTHHIGDWYEVPTEEAKTLYDAGDLYTNDEYQKGLLLGVVRDEMNRVKTYYARFNL